MSELCNKSQDMLCKGCLGAQGDMSCDVRQECCRLTLMAQEGESRGQVWLSFLLGEKGGLGDGT